MTTLKIDQQLLNLDGLRAIWAAPAKIELGADAKARVNRAQRCVDQVVDEGRTVYGVNTGFGLLANVHIERQELSNLQENLIRSHAVGVGEALDEATVRLILALKIYSLARGHSGVHLETVDRLLRLFNAEAYPVIPAQGSVGASGDLAPLAHMSLTLIGEGQLNYRGEVRPAIEVLGQLGLQPLKLAPKEGLALLNGTQVSTAITLAAGFRTERLLAAGLVAGALSVDAVRGSDTPFDTRIQDLRAHPGQHAVATCLRRLMEGSQIRESHRDCKRVQDPYSIRCQPQVTGACLDALWHTMAVLETEANSVSDNPLIFPDTGEVLSGGNFHAEPVAMAADYLALAIAETASISERRIALLIDPHLSELPPFLVEHSGINSGFMIAHVTAAALASDNKALAHPASVDSLPTSANQEDHVSMATNGGLRLHRMLDNSVAVVAIELIAAAQGVEFRRPLRSSKSLESVISHLRAHVPHYDADRSLAPDIEKIQRQIGAGYFVPLAKEIFRSSCRGLP